MGLLTSNHVSLLSACYPPPTKPLLPLSSIHAISNELSKLLFYLTKSRKIPALTSLLGQRIEKSLNKYKKGERGGMEEVVVGLEIFGEIVVQEGGKGQMGCFLISALKGVAGGLGLEGEGKWRAGEMFGNVMTFLEGENGLGNDAEENLRKILRMVKGFCTGSQLENKLIGLKIMEVLTTTEIFYSNKYFTQWVSIVLESILGVCFEGEVADLEMVTKKFVKKEIVRSEKRKAVKLVRADSPFDSILLLEASVHSLLNLIHNSTQLLVILEEIVKFLDEIPSNRGYTDDNWIDWLIKALTSANPSLHAKIIDFFTEKLLSSDENSTTDVRANQFVRIISILLKRDAPIVGLGIKNLLSNLISILFNRVHLLSADQLSPLILELVGDLASKNYYPEMGNEMIEDLVEGMLRIRAGNFNEEEQVWGLRECVRAIENVIESKPPNSPKIEGNSLLDSLFLLTEVDNTLRRESQQMIMNYIKKELPSPNPITSSTPSSPKIILPLETNFFIRLTATIFELLTVPSLGLLTNSSAAMTRSTSTRSKSSRRSYKGNLLHAIATPLDFTKMIELLTCLVEKKEGRIILILIPMLLNLEKELEFCWNEKNSKGERKERIQGGKEVVGVTLRKMGEIFEILGLERIGREAQARLTPSVLPFPIRSNTPFSKVGESFDLSNNLDSRAVIAALSGSKGFQAATGLEEMEIREILSAEWSIEEVRSRSSPRIERMSYRALGSKSVNNSRVRLPSSTFSNRSGFTSVSDLKLVVGEIHLSSSRNSISSISNGSIAGKRRTTSSRSVSDLVASLKG